MSVVGWSCTQAVLSRGADISVAVGTHRKQFAAEVREKVREPEMADQLEEVWRQADSSDDQVVDLSDFREALEKSGILGADCTYERMAILMSFVTPQAWGEVDSSELTKFMELWTATQMQAAEWEEWFEEHGQTQDAVLKLLKRVNGPDGRVAQCEAEWVWELMTSTSPDLEQQRFALRVSVAYWALFSTSRNGLLRDKLLMRLELEHSFGEGCVRFVILVLLFGLFTLSLHYSSKGGPSRGIYSNLVSLYGLDSIGQKNTWTAVREYLKQFSDASSALAPLSQRYFSGGAELNLLVQQQTFDAPAQLSDVSLWLGRGFTLQAWVSVTEGMIPPVGGMPIFRRALSAAGAGADLSCLSWNFPPSIAFGAHDYGLPTPNNITGRMEEFVAAVYPEDESRRPAVGSPDFIEYTSMRMHTMVVNDTSVSFYVNDGILIGSFTARRPVTDCADAETTVGSLGLTLAAVSYTPTPVTAQQVAEMFRQGTLLSNTGYSIKSEQVAMLSGFELLNREGITDRITTKETSMSATYEVAASAGLSSLAVTSPVDLSMFTPYSNKSVVPAQRLDDVLGIPVWNIFPGPVYTSAASENKMAGDALPRMSPTDGFAISVWLKFEQANNGYLIARSIPAWTGEAYEWTGYSDMCWTVYVGGGATALRLRSGMAGMGYGGALNIDDTLAPKDEQFQGKAYRHFLFQVDPKNTTHPVQICIDATCDDDYRSVADLEGFPPVDCEGTSYLQEKYPEDKRQGALEKAEIWINRRPPGAWAYTGFMKNLKFFNRSLTIAEISKLFDEDKDPESNDGTSLRQKEGCKTTAETVDDPSFKDDFGHDCFWYYNTRIRGMENCNRNQAARAKCPVACLSSEACWGSSSSAVSDSMWIWAQQQEFRSKGSWGTSCVAKSTTAAKEAIKCGKGATNNVAGCAALGVKQCAPVDCTAFEEDEEALLRCLGDVVWMSGGSNPPENRFMPCAEIIRTNEPTCEWDDSELDRVATSINETREWSIQFWFEPVRTSECLQPQMRFLDGDGFTFSYLAGWLEVQVDPPLGPGCNTNTWLSHALHGKKSEGYPQLSEADVPVAPNYPKPGEKHYVVLGRAASGLVMLQYDSDSNTDNANQNGGHPPIKPNKDFLRVINVFGDVRLSSMKLSNRIPSAGDVAKTRYTQLSMQQQRRGSTPTLQQQRAKMLDRQVSVFTERVFMISPPVVMQTRWKAAACPWSFSDRVIQQFFDMGLNRHCVAPYICADYAPSNVFQCPDGSDDSLFFGILPQDFLGRKVYLEFLTTITNFPIVVRRRVADGPYEIMRTENFLDTLTEEIEIVALFYSAEFSITSRLTVTFAAIDSSVQGDFDIQHFIPLMGDDLADFQVIQYLIICVQLLLFVDNLKLFRDIWKSWGYANMKVSYDIIILAIDCTIQITALTFFGLASSFTIESGAKTEEYIGNLQRFDWSDRDTSVETKKENFRKMMDTLSQSMEDGRVLNTIGLAVAMVIFMRVIMATNAHPRIALITSTFAVAASDMIHFSMLFFLVLWGFAIIGSWRFGGSRSDMKDVLTAMQTQFDAILGPPGALPVFGEDSEDPAYLVFVVVLHFVNFFFLVNFFLAIVVEAFTKNVRNLETNDTEQDILTDTIEQIYTSVKGVVFWWPANSKLIVELKGICKRYITSEDLIPVLFKNEAHAHTFVEHYSRHSFVMTDGNDRPNIQRLYDDHRVTESKIRSIAKALDGMGKTMAGTATLRPTGTYGDVTGVQPNSALMPHAPAGSLEETVRELCEECRRSNILAAKERERYHAMLEAASQDRERCAKLLDTATQLMQATQAAQGTPSSAEMNRTLQRQIAEAAAMRQNMQSLHDSVQGPGARAGMNLPFIATSAGGPTASLDESGSTWDTPARFQPRLR